MVKRYKENSTFWFNTLSDFSNCYTGIGHASGMLSEQEAHRGEPEGTLQNKALPGGDSVYWIW